MTDAVNNRSELESRLRDHADHLHEFGVDRVYVFGSFAQGTHSQDSDIDLLVEFAEGTKSFDAFMELNFFLEDLLGRSVELVTPESLRPRFRDAIEAQLHDVRLPERPNSRHPRRGDIPGKQSR